MFGVNRIRYRSPARVLAEIDTLHNTYDENIKIMDEMFVLRDEYVSAICDGLIDQLRAQYLYARIDTVTRKMLDKLNGRV